MGTQQHRNQEVPHTATRGTAPADSKGGDSAHEWVAREKQIARRTACELFKHPSRQAAQLVKAEIQVVKVCEPIKDAVLQVAQLVVGEMQPGKACEPIKDTVRQAAQLAHEWVAREIQIARRTACELFKHPSWQAAQLVKAEIQVLKAGKPIKDAVLQAAQLVVVETQGIKACEPIKDAVLQTDQLVVAEIQSAKASEVAECLDATLCNLMPSTERVRVQALGTQDGLVRSARRQVAQLVVGEMQPGKACEPIKDTVRQAAQLVAIERQIGKTREVAECVGCDALQPLVIQDKVSAGTWDTGRAGEVSPQLSRGDDVLCRVVCTASDIATPEITRPERGHL
eukprot:CAMPEP_0173414926 /NCGR_PEP_ID=MMETSP1356-20130122/84580_1 /TAXON_ID=77927 ORGANISM="Hemiselmis virescens, Strain PCC157" /NCGR_SAMPLE_ID=MMETSP1356 /ASSEMBLY_ACC=CAM_ASM_000847 /LENGTH=340 /DNA_ID=CAMNT_0014377137 /DNA_START=1505 /DNA_END=2529 /DNA_ORIENTATION=-